MLRRLAVVPISCAVLASCLALPARAATDTDCAYDRARLLALDEMHFDQDMAGGWRALAAKAACQRAAADLLRDYRQAHRSEAGILYWHEGQLRAFAGQAPEAIALMEQARKPADADHAGWNPYVDATIAFLRKDRPALDAARAAGRRAARHRARRAAGGRRLLRV